MYSIHLVVFILVFEFGSSFGEECPEIFLRYNARHSYCQPRNPKCEILSYHLTEDDKQEILKLHNTFRSTIAMGKGKGPQVLPSASNMLEMEWDDELAQVAQKYAEQCLFEHDCSDCRRVMNFGVGQNIAIQKVTGSDIFIPQPDWKFAVGEWFAEIIYFPAENVCPFQGPFNPKEEEFRHFSQVSWAESFRVGCGYVLYKEGAGFGRKTYARLYYCNYGPQGNMYEECMYEKGKPCSRCPLDTCCGKNCSNYPGLCRRLTDSPPLQPLPQNAIMHCDFRENVDCNFYTEGKDAWTIISSLSGNYLEIILKEGESSTITLENQIPENEYEICIQIKYRKGPILDGRVSANTAKGIIFTSGSRNTWELPEYDGSFRHQFSVFSMSMSYSPDYQVIKELSISFEVPPGQFIAQFLNIKEILVTSGLCSV